GKPEPSEPNGHGNVKGHRTSRVAQTESLVSDVSRVDGSAHGPRAPSPKQIHSVRCRRSGEKAEYDTNGGVCQAGEQCRSEPASVDRFSCTLNRLTHCRLVSANPRPFTLTLHLYQEQTEEGRRRTSARKPPSEGLNHPRPP